ncbi:MAG: efflux RND transporter periplasmic adaptor subunit [Cellvibrionaceae bacterium]
MVMTSTLFSASWYLVEDLCPRLRRHTAIHRHVYRDETWYVLQDHATGQFHRFTPEAYLIIGKMNGELTLQQIWEEACELLGDHMPTQDDVIGLVSKLFRANVLHSDTLPDMEALGRRRQVLERQKLMQKIKSPLALRLPLLDPEKFLTKTNHLIAPLFSRWMGVLWLLVIALGLLLAAVNWGELTSNLSDRVLVVENLLLIALIYPVVKTIHELGHAYAVKRWGGEVHEIGIMFLVFFPVPYVDASAATAFRNKFQRMLVGAIGIMVEGFVAALAMVVWAMAEPGLVRALALNTMMIAGVSTFFFNGNPLLRFDAYYVLADYLEIPNLATRANQYVGYWVKRYVMGVKGLHSPAATTKEACWLFFYAVAAYLYRTIIMLTISLFIAGKYIFVGVLLAAWTLYSSILKPLIQLAAKPFTDSQLQLKPRRTWGVIGGVFAVLVLLLAVVPFPYATYTHGVLSASDNTQIRVSTSGFVTEVVAEPGGWVEKGELIIRMSDPALEAKTEVMRLQVEEAQARWQASLRDRVESGIQRDLLSFREQEYGRLLKQRKALDFVAHRSGVVILPQIRGMHGRYLGRGEFVGDIVDYSQLPIQALIREDDISAVRHRTRSVEVKLVSQPAQSYEAMLSRIVPSSTQLLPSTILSTEAGGVVATQPAGEGEEPRAFNRHFRVVLNAQEMPKVRINERVHILFHHDPEPLMWRWMRDIRRVFLRQLDV